MTTTAPQTSPATEIPEAPLAPRPVPVGNLVPDLNDVNAFTLDKIAAAAVDGQAPWSRGHAAALGALVWTPGTLQTVRDAHRHLPELRTLDRVGNRIDAVDYHPAWHQLMSLAFGHGVHALAWTAGQPGSHLARAVLSYLWNQVDGATACPTGMAYAALPMLRETPELAVYADKVAVHGYDPMWAPIESKTAATVAYAMTEKQGGSDLRANVTIANPVGARGAGEAYLLSGHKWFCSVPKADLIITVAQTQAGLSCFAIPRFRPDGTVNGVRISRLKDKLGNRANASAEIEYHDTYALLIGEEGRGVRTILSSSEYTRLDFAVGSAGLIRAALSQALHYSDRRTAFGSPLSRLPIQAAVLADLVLEWVGAAYLAFRLAGTLDARHDASQRLLERVLTPVAKYWNCKRAPLVAEEAIECIGGNGYIEEHPLPRYYREAPLNAIWEGTSNMMVLDVQRVLTREPKAIEPLLDEVRDVAHAEPRLTSAVAEIEELIKTPGLAGRRLVSKIALAAQAALLVRNAPPAIADAFCASRLGHDWEPTFGTLPAGVDTAAIIEFGRLD
jgi:putative acyl-CoA dehydrogenase